MVGWQSPDDDSRVAAVYVRGDGTIALYIEVTSFRPGQAVEISGYLTQAGGAITSFYQISHIPLPDPDSLGGTAVMHVTVPAMRLVEGEDITVVTRVAEVWSTVLTRDTPEPSTGTWAASQPKGAGEAWALEETRAVSPPAGTRAAWKFKSATRWGDDQLPPA
jgi:hypothetical protein